MTQSPSCFKLDNSLPTVDLPWWQPCLGRESHGSQTRAHAPTYSSWGCSFSVPPTGPASHECSWSTANKQINHLKEATWGHIFIYLWNDTATGTFNKLQCKLFILRAKIRNIECEETGCSSTVEWNHPVFKDHFEQHDTKRVVLASCQQNHTAPPTRNILIRLSSIIISCADVNWKRSL